MKKGKAKTSAPSNGSPCRSEQGKDGIAKLPLPSSDKEEEALFEEGSSKRIPEQSLTQGESSHSHNTHLVVLDTGHNEAEASVKSSAESVSGGSKRDNSMKVDMPVIDIDNPFASAREVLNNRWPLEIRVKLYREFERVLKDHRKMWTKDGGAQCRECEHRHPPPCIGPDGAEQLRSFRQDAKRVLAQWAKENAAKDPVQPKETKGKQSQKSKVMLCTNCAYWHRGGAAECEAPVCKRSGCGFNHYPTEPCRKVRRRFDAKNLLEAEDEPAEKSITNKPAAQQGTLDDSDITKIAALWDEMTPTQLASLFSQIVSQKGEGKKRKAKDNSEAGASPPLPSKKPKDKAPEGNGDL
ncbi:hypothetical protein N0V90_011335 [Kalmusia sp. IMI 367209]|nr:hypothetical protein N0V90_011335 [Kalmusia sp. IMI 367209]